MTGRPGSPGALSRGGPGTHVDGPKGSSKDSGVLVKMGWEPVLVSPLQLSLAFRLQSCEGSVGAGLGSPKRAAERVPWVEGGATALAT